MASAYLTVLFSGLPVVMAYNLLSGTLRALGDSRSPLTAMVLASLVNIGLDLLFVLVFCWGVVSAAAATVIAQVISCLFCLFRLRGVDFMRLRRPDFAFDGPRWSRLMRLGAPVSGQNCVIAVGGMIIQSVVNGFGVAFLAGFTASNKLYGVLEIAATSYGYAMITYVGQNLGAQKLNRIKQGMRCALTVAIATSAVIGGVMLIFGKVIVGLFISGTPNEVVEATRVGYEYLVVMSLCLPVLYILHVVRSAIQGLGNTVIPMVSGVAEFIMRTGGVLLLPAVIGHSGVFRAEVLAWLGADLILVPGYFLLMRRLRNGKNDR